MNPYYENNKQSEYETHFECECAKPEYAEDEYCPLDTGEAEHCEQCCWARLIID